MSNSLSTLYIIRKPKDYTTGPVPIYLRITVDGQRFEISTNRSCDPEKWNKEAGRVNGTKFEIKQINAHLDSLVYKIHCIQTELLNSGKSITAESIKNKFTGKAEKGRMLVPIFEMHNKQVAELVDREYAPATLARYKISLQHVINFMQWKYFKSDIDIKELTHEFITDYNFYLRSVKNCNNNSAAKYIKNFRKIIGICIKNGWLDRDPFINFKLKIKEPDRIFLSEQEVNAIEQKEFIIPRLSQVKDIFLFCCYTGLAYVDVKELTRNNIVLGIDGKYWINTTRAKTDTPSHIPLIPPALALLEKYNNHPQVLNNMVLFPVLSNQNMNAYLKEIADLCGINKILTFHCARHTFATTITLTSGVPIESVSKMLGHKNLRTTQHYAKILDLKVSKDMSVLHNKYKPKEEEKLNENTSAG